MEKIRYHTLLKMLKWMINLALLAEIIVAVVLFVMFIITIGTDEGSLVSTWPIQIEKHYFENQITSNHENLNDLSVAINSGSIQFSSDGFGYYLLKIIDALCLLAIAISITLLLKRIFLSLVKQHPFVMDNAKSLRSIAFLVLLIMPYSLIKNLIYRSFIMNHITIEEKEYASFLSLFSKPASNEILLGTDMNIQALVAGMILFIIAEVFRIGIVIKEDNESIV